jgi:hypothetical protein
MDSKSLNALRLSARTLAEWRTPSSNRSYESVFNDLLSFHPFARTLGIRSKSEVLSLDNDGSILWFLSETLISDYSVVDEFGDDLQCWIAENCIGSLVSFARIGLDDIEAWPNGPFISQVADEIDLTLEEGLRQYRDVSEATKYINRDTDTSTAATALVSIAAALDNNLRLATMMELKVDYTNRYLQRASAVIRKIVRTTGGIKYASSITTICGVLAFGLSFFSDHLSSNYTGILTSIAIFAALAAKFIGTIFEHGTITSKPVRVAMRLLAIPSVFPRMADLDASRKEALGSALIVSLGRLCGTRHQAMLSLFKNGSDDRWRRAALLGTTSVKASIVKEILPIIRSPELNFAMRNELVKWLFGVAIMEDSAA